MIFLTFFTSLANGFGPLGRGIGASTYGKCDKMKCLFPVVVSIFVASNLEIANADIGNKYLNLKPSEIATVVGDDITIRQALVTADFTREIYAEG